MLSGLYHLARPLLFRLAPEAAHERTLQALETGLYPRPFKTDDARLAQTVLGLRFPNPVGIAAGFDKDARVPDAVLGLGCGFAEIGTVTPKPQSGNPSPRVFRLIEDHGLINRLGFNNAGHAAALARLLLRGPGPGIVGVNIGANKDSADRTADYVAGLVAFNDVAQYFTVNISSPNTPGLRDLQAPAALDELLGRIAETRITLAAKGKPRRPIVIKIAPDIAEADVAGITDRILAHGMDAIAVSNTTLARDGLTSLHRSETGGLSGRPLFVRSTAMLARVYKATGGRIPLIGIGGIDTPQSAIAKIKAGATLLQLYTGMIYEGPALISRIKDEIAAELSKTGAASVAELTGTEADRWEGRA